MRASTQKGATGQTFSLFIVPCRAMSGDEQLHADVHCSWVQHMQALIRSRLRNGGGKLGGGAAGKLGNVEKQVSV